MSNLMQSFCYVENCVLAHLCYEQRLLEIEAQKCDHGEGNLPDIGGQAFFITDAGPPRTAADLYITLTTLTDGECTFMELSPTMMLFVAHVIEAYHITRHRLLRSRCSLVRLIAGFLPALSGDVAKLQPSLFSLTSTHVVLDDSRARLSPAKGGLGYNGSWTTLEGLHKTLQECLEKTF